MQGIKLTNTSKSVISLTSSSDDLDFIDHNSSPEPTLSSSSSSSTASLINTINTIRSKLTLKTILGSLLAIVAIALMVLSCISGSFVQRGFVQIMNFVKDINIFVGSIFFILFDTLTVVLVLPGTPGNLAAGYIFGTFVGSVVSILGITFGAIAAFMLGRTLMRTWALQKMEEYPKFKAIDKAIADNAFLLIFLMRFSPLMPFAVCCYMLGATRVSWVTYSVASLFGLSIPTAAYCHLGSLMKDLSSMWEKGGDAKNNSFTYVVVFAVATIMLVVLITYITKKALDNAIKKSEAGMASGDIMGVNTPEIQLQDCSQNEVSDFVLTSIMIDDNDFKKSQD